MATLIESPAEPKVEQSPLTTRRRFTVAEYNLMGEAGILQPDERVELIKGEIQKRVRKEQSIPQAQRELMTVSENT